MKALQDSKVTHITSGGHVYTFASFERDGEAMVLFTGGETHSDRHPAMVEISAREAIGVVEALDCEDLHHGYDSPEGEYRLSVYRSKRDNPDVEGFEIGVEKPGTGHIFGGFFEDGHHVHIVQEARAVTRDEFIEATKGGTQAIICVHRRSGKRYRLNGGFRENYEATIAEPGPYSAIAEPLDRHPRDPSGLRFVDLASMRLADPIHKSQLRCPHGRP